MPEWMYWLIGFALLTTGYIVGFLSGTWKSDAAPTPSVWRAVREHAIESNMKVAIHEIDANHEEQMEMIRRGIYDDVTHVIGFPDKTEEDDDKEGDS